MVAPGQLRAALHERPCYSTFLTLQDPQAIAYLAGTGLDFLIIDHEHITMDAHMVAQLVMTAHTFGIATIVRVRELSRGAIQHALETGCDGVMVPMIESAAQARLAVEWSKYPPEGTRGLHTLTQAFLLHQKHFASGGEYTQVVNRQLVVVLQIETARGFAARDEICAVPGADVIFIGTSDLSQSFGVSMTSPELDQAVEKIIVSAKQGQKMIGIIGGSYQSLSPFGHDGVNFLTLGADGALLMHGVRSLLAGK
jgi:4-hydroxy-2-oxoheptanedioate aldolase